MARARRNRKGDVNKSQAIRDLVAERGNKVRPRDIIAELAQKGIEVSPALVTNVISRGTGRKTRGRRPGVAARGGSGQVSITTLLEAKRLVTEAGSVDDAKRALDTLSRLL